MILNARKILTNRKILIGLHILAWAIIMVIPRYIMHAYGDVNNHFLVRLYINIAVYGLLFYLNYSWLFPAFYYRKGWRGYYFLAAAVLMGIVCVGLWYLNDHVLIDKEQIRQITRVIKEINKEGEVIKPPIGAFRIMNYFYTSVLIMGFSMGLKLVEQVSREEKVRKELEKEKLNSELAFLKNQISPHFFFNTLNNIYSLIGMNTGKARESVLKLSKLMRYLLYESERGESRLSEEITFLENYIDLMKLRLTDKVDLLVSLPEKYPDHSIPPLLFMAFIENAFKHGISYREASFINIELTASEDQIRLSVRNSIGKGRLEKVAGYTGIGLENIKKRLGLLYPGRHTLKISENEKEFLVELSLMTGNG
ncbi:MAG: histidine kinase [Bacteroidales bacterium]|nr:histidine kinase [Bacteroidales bacterium]